MWCLYLSPLFTAQTAWQHVNQTTPQRPSCREFQTTQPNHPSTLFLRSYKTDLIFLHPSSERYNHLCGNICSRLKNELIRVYDKLEWARAQLASL